MNKFELIHFSAVGYIFYDFLATLSELQTSVRNGGN